jgi:hypothetical protein
MSLRQFQTYGAAANDNEMRNAMLVRENCLVREVGNAVEPWNGRYQRRGACCYNEAARLDPIIVGPDGILVNEAGGRLYDLDAEPVEALDGIVGRNGVDNALHMGGDRLVIDAHLAHANAELSRVPDFISAFGGGQERFGGNTAVVQALAAHLSPLDENNGNTKGGGDGGGG